MNLQNSLGLLHSYTDEELVVLSPYTEYKRVQLASLNCSVIAQCINQQLTNQEYMMELTRHIQYNVFQYHYNTCLLEETISYQSTQLHPEPWFSLLFHSDHLTIKTPIAFTLHELIQSPASRTQRYLCFHVGLEREMNTESAHSCILIIDNWMRSPTSNKRFIYLLDPNGTTRSYVTRSTSNQHVLTAYDKCESALEMFFEGYDLIYQRQDTMNPLHLNGQLGDIMLMESGNCVLISLFLIDFLSTTQESISDMYRQLARLNQTEREQLLLMYASALFNRLESI